MITGITAHINPHCMGLCGRVCVCVCSTCLSDSVCPERISVTAVCVWTCVYERNLCLVLVQPPYPWPIVCSQTATEELQLFDAFCYRRIWKLKLSSPASFPWTGPVPAAGALLQHWLHRAVSGLVKREEGLLLVLGIMTTLWHS